MNEAFWGYRDAAAYKFYQPDMRDDALVWYQKTLLYTIIIIFNIYFLTPITSRIVKVNIYSIRKSDVFSAWEEWLSTLNDSLCSNSWCLSCHVIKLILVTPHSRKTWRIHSPWHGRFQRRQDSQAKSRLETHPGEEKHAIRAHINNFLLRTGAFLCHQLPYSFYTAKVCNRNACQHD